MDFIYIFLSLVWPTLQVLNSIITTQIYEMLLYQDSTLFKSIDNLE